MVQIDGDSSQRDHHGSCQSDAILSVRENPAESKQVEGWSKAMKKYLIIVEESETGYSSFSPDAPGCGSTGKTKDAVERNIQAAIEFHLEGLREEGYEIPEPSSYSSYVEVAA